MRKFLGLCALVLVLLALSGPALAQDDVARDPFVPLISPIVPDGGTTDPTVPVDPGVPIVEPEPTDPLPGTGSPAVTWIGLAYVLIALGGGAVVLSKLFGPVRVAAR